MEVKSFSQSSEFNDRVYLLVNFLIHGADGKELLDINARISFTLTPVAGVNTLNIKVDDFDTDMVTVKQFVEEFDEQAFEDMVVEAMYDVILKANDHLLLKMNLDIEVDNLTLAEGTANNILLYSKVPAPEEKKLTFLA